MSYERATEAAFEIGKKLARDAIWDGDRCNWLGPTNDFFMGRVCPGYGMLGPNVYDGTAGVSIFLAQLFRVTRDPIIRRTGIGSIRHALSRSTDVTQTTQLSFYTGHAGIAYAAIEAGRLFERDDIFQAGMTMLLELGSYDISDKCILDVLIGLGATIPTVLSLVDITAESELIERMLSWANAIVDAAKQSDRGLSWNTSDELRLNMGSKEQVAPWLASAAVIDQPNLLGYAHGAGGIALALLELGIVTGNSRLRDAAASGFDYENSWFDYENNRWPDLRFYQDQSNAAATHVAWCHGASGIGLTRARAWKLTREQRYKDDAVRAFAITHEALGQRLQPRTNFCLCHGIAGDAELFLQDDDDLYPCSPDLIQQVTQFGIETYHKANRPWPYGSSDFHTPPGLMLGLAGTGYFYLRVSDKANTPSILMLTPTGRGQ
jgi:lantibiotic modifying enzyme